jgi:hypothetical protein
VGAVPALPRVVQQVSHLGLLSGPVVVLVPHVLPPNSASVGRGADVVFPLLGEG